MWKKHPGNIDILSWSPGLGLGRRNVGIEQDQGVSSAPTIAKVKGKSDLGERRRETGTWRLGSRGVT